MMTCEACRRVIAALGMDEALPAAAADHLDRCPECAALLVQERHVRSALATAPWPTSSLAGDLPRLMQYAADREPERLLRRRRLLRRWASGFVLIAVIASLGAMLMWMPTARLEDRGLGWLPPALAIGAALVALAWLEVLARRLASAGATLRLQLGVGLGRAAIGLALIVAVIEPARWAELPYAIARLAGGPAAAQGGIVEAELVCAASADGRLRVARASEGCRGHEVPVALDGRVGGSVAPTVDGLAIRFGSATIPAGERDVTVAFSPPMVDTNYRVIVSPQPSDKPIATDDACHMLGGRALSTDHFGLAYRRCWYEGSEVPHDRLASDVTVDWVVIGER